MPNFSADAPCHGWVIATLLNDIWTYLLTKLAEFLAGTLWRIGKPVLGAALVKGGRPGRTVLTLLYGVDLAILLLSLGPLLPGQRDRQIQWTGAILLVAILVVAIVRQFLRHQQVPRYVVLAILVVCGYSIVAVIDSFGPIASFATIAAWTGAFWLAVLVCSSMLAHSLRSTAR